MVAAEATTSGRGGRIEYGRPYPSGSQWVAAVFELAYPAIAALLIGGFVFVPGTKKT